MTNKIITFGEVLLRLASPNHLRFNQTTEYNATFGGGEANVAISLSNFGIPTEHVTRIPNNDIARACVMELRKYGVGIDKIVYGGERLGIYFLETGAVSRGSKVVYDRANSSMATIEKGMIDWDHVFDGATWFHWTGITPAISKGAAEVCLEAIQKANEKGITVSCDMNFRKHLWSYGTDPKEIMPDLVAGTDIVLANVEDADKMLGIKIEGIDPDDNEKRTQHNQLVSQEIMQKFPRCKKVINTLRSTINADYNLWACTLWDGNKMYESATYEITHIVDRVGGGDSLMGGIIYGLLTWPEETQKTLNFAVAASCLKHTIHGDFNQITVDEALKLMGGDATGRVDR